MRLTVWLLDKQTFGIDFIFSASDTIKIHSLTPSSSSATEMVRKWYKSHLNLHPTVAARLGHSPPFSANSRGHSWDKSKYETKPFKLGDFFKLAFQPYICEECMAEMLKTVRVSFASQIYTSTTQSVTEITVLSELRCSK